ncbi:PEP/pyruvate-binding domain-containing protein [Deinococcus sp. SM5_A1]|uniref:PEP/pyruvate-binding domain-containing protein n=1 Tax=Deinococcus sp. SM5_A1 TaxID=3379094 RepID=UPI0038581473
MNSLPWCLPLSAVTSADRPLVGGKAVGLAQLIQAGLPVPDGLVITTHAMAALQDKAQTSQVRTELQIQLARLNASAYAVRSSAPHEDGVTHSYAGHYASYLNVSAQEVEVAVRRCWASLNSVQAAYAGQHLSMAVVVQALAPSEASGVAFSQVTAGDRAAVGIEAVYGLGEALVSGLLRPQRFTFDLVDLSLLHQELTPQAIMLCAPAQKGPCQLLYGDTVTVLGREMMVVRQERVHGTLAVRLPDDLSQQACLPGTAQMALVRAALQAEAHFGHPVDLEWVWTGTELLFVQARPITQNVAWPVSPHHAPQDTGRKFGLAAAPGLARGRAVQLQAHDTGETVEEGDIMVAYQTFPKWFFAMRRAGGVVTETGGLLSHAAIVARELGVPCIVGVPDAGAAWPTGTLLTVDGTNGSVSPEEIVTGSGPSPALPTAAPALQSGYSLAALWQLRLQGQGASSVLPPLALPAPGVALSPDEQAWWHALNVEGDHAPHAR